jgi:hypothetical protein
MGGLCLFLGGCIRGTYRMSEGIAKETEGEHKGSIEASELVNWRVVEFPKFSPLSCNISPQRCFRGKEGLLSTNIQCLQHQFTSRFRHFAILPLTTHHSLLTSSPTRHFLYSILYPPISDLGPQSSDFRPPNSALCRPFSNELHCAPI